jgi:hypothetical protein
VVQLTMLHQLLKVLVRRARSRTTADETEQLNTVSYLVTGMEEIVAKLRYCWDDSSKAEF